MNVRVKNEACKFIFKNLLKSKDYQKYNFQRVMNVDLGRNFIVTEDFVNKKVRVQNGKKGRVVKFNNFMLGYKLGSFSPTKKVAFHEAKYNPNFRKKKTSGNDSKFKKVDPFVTFNRLSSFLRKKIKDDVEDEEI